jgi:hypothetical protein
MSAGGVLPPQVDLPQSHQLGVEPVAFGPQRHVLGV